MWWIVFPVSFGLFMIFVILDNRKKIFKKRTKKVEEKKQVDLPKEEKKKVELKRKEISFQKTTPITTNSGVKEEEREERYSTVENFSPRRMVPNRRYIPQGYRPIREEVPVKKSFRQEFDQLSPAMKAAVLTGFLKKRDDV